jgi:NAD(P)-dependent dehydrogenase (short-subunit alcohol dehydrogenase family)
MKDEQRVAIVTGAARGLGQVIALGLAEAGLKVVALCRPRPDGAAMSGPEVSHENLLQVEADVTSEADCVRAVAVARAEFGSADILINNAAVTHDAFPKFHDSLLADIALPDWQKVFDVNVTGAFLMARSIVPGMVERGWGRVINLSTSMSSMLAPGVLPYGPSKAALEAMTVGWSQQLKGSGITVNELLPGGPTAHADNPKSWRAQGVTSWPARMMVPPVRWLVSSASDGITGRRFIARLWDPELPDCQAAAEAGFRAGWPLPPHEFATAPTP